MTLVSRVSKSPASGALRHGPRLAVTLLLLAVGWTLRRRPILGPLVLLLIGAALSRLWRDTSHDAVVHRGYQALTRTAARARR
ncbi:MAG: hypothetical protein ACRDUA_11650 [Micromonosporaceae bacterium]